LISGLELREIHDTLSIEPYQSLWISNRNGHASE
jgi:hypothetical protein